MSPFFCSKYYFLIADSTRPGLAAHITLGPEHCQPDPSPRLLDAVQSATLPAVL